MLLTDRASPRITDARVITLVGMAHAVSHFFHLILVPLFPWLRAEFALTFAQLGLLMSVFFTVSAVGQVFAGFLVDRAGALRVLFVGLVFLCTSALVLATAQNYGALMFGALLAGLGNSVFHPADFALLNQRVGKSRLGHAFSIHGVAGSLGWAFAPAFLTITAAQYGWRAALSLASLIPVAALLLLRFYRNSLPDEICNTPDTVRRAGTRTYSLGFLRVAGVWIGFAFFLITALAMGGIQNFSALSLGVIYRGPVAWTTTGLTLYMIGSALGMLWGGFLAAKATHHDRTVALSLSCAASSAVLIATGLPSPWVALLLMAGLGFGSGIAGPSRDLLIRAAAPKAALGRVYGLVYSGLDIGLATSPMLFGALMDAHQPQRVFLWIALFQCAAILTAIGVGANTRKQWDEPVKDSTTERV